MEARKLAREVSSAVNCFGFDTKGFCEEMSREHRTLQQNFTRLCVDWLRTLSEYKEFQYDERNRLSVEAARTMIEAFDANEHHLPMI